MEMACRLAMGRDRDIVDGDMATGLYFAGKTQKMIAQKILRQKSYFLYNAHLVRGLIFRCLIFRKRFVLGWQHILAQISLSLKFQTFKTKFRFDKTFGRQLW